MEDTPLTAVIDWLRQRNPDAMGRYGDEPDLDLDLIEHRIVDSLSFMEFVLLLEDLIGRELPLKELDVDRFRTLRAISENFFSSERTG
ncbi:phosphopantetheine-binding protein [Streptomyces sp. NPDC093109]|uniref:phosphopantetheine-binding protein n=1 Tax=Streptomyces sp. NPDC093109 TaxID=3154977 RepID=UPI00344DAB2F